MSFSKKLDHLIIPMSGTGNRFIEKGYKDPKPFIIIDGSPMICHVVNMFFEKGEPLFKKLTFIVNKDHDSYLTLLDSFSFIDGVITNIISIDPHKEGPVYTTSKIFNFAGLINPNEDVIVCYCDFNSYFSFSKFLKRIEDDSEESIMGAIFAYKGFHPHMISAENYAFMKINEDNEDNEVLEIQEKKPYTDNRLLEYASNGIYYFRKTSDLVKYSMLLMDLNERVNGEFYVSMIYNLMIKDSKKVVISEIQHMLQWGTPKHLEEYQEWSNLFKDYKDHRDFNSSIVEFPEGTSIILPCAGYGSRFKDPKYKNPKPLLPINGNPMVIEAIKCLPRASKNVFICLNEHKDIASPYFKEFDKNCEIISIDKVTEGQACTCMLGLKENLNIPICITACDNGILYNEEKLNKMLLDTSIDVIVFSFSSLCAFNYPHMYSWLSFEENENGIIKEVFVKNQNNTKELTKESQAIVGTMFFRKSNYFTDAFKQTYEEGIKTNGEYYVDNVINKCISNGLKVKSFKVDHYICWGTSNDYEIFLYWQSYFHKTSPYKVKNLELKNKIENENVRI